MSFYIICIYIPILLPKTLTVGARSIRIDWAFPTGSRGQCWDGKNAINHVYACIVQRAHRFCRYYDALGLVKRSDVLVMPNP